MPLDIFNQLLNLVGVTHPGDDIVEIVGSDPVYDTPFKVGEASAAILAAQGAAIREIWLQRGGRDQKIKTDVRAAATETAGVFFQSQHGYPIPVPDPDYPTVGFYPTLDGRHILLHGGYPKLRDGLLSLLCCADDRNSIGHAVAKWNSFELEDVIAERGLAGAVARTHEEWLAHPQGQAIADMPVVEIIKLGDSKPEPFKRGAARPLSDLKVVDCTHVIAGPTCAKTLASQGAEVLHITCPSRPRLPPFDIDTSHGKLSAFLDLKIAKDNHRLRELVKDAAVFSQSYRPGKLTSLGFSPHGLAEMRPGIVVVSTSCYGHAGPWHFRPGFEQLAQSCTGMAIAQGSIDSPQLAPTFPNDYLTGFLGALGTLAALLRRSKEGGSYHVRVSLARSATWLQSLGKVSRDALPPEPLPQSYISSLLRKEVGPLGELTYFAPTLQLSETPPRWERPAEPLGAHFPVWADQQNKALQSALA
jgi:hypothetical protein